MFMDYDTQHDIENEGQRAIPRDGIRSVIPHIRREGVQFILVIHPEKGKNSPVYPINIATCCDYPGILKWIAHLGYKQWFTREHLNAFIGALSAEFGINFHE